MIREIKKEDLDEVYELICELEQKQINYDRFQNVFFDSFLQDDIYQYVYEYENHVIGFISLYIHHYLHHQYDTGEIVELIVSPQYRGIKIGDCLIRHVEEKARALQLEEIELSTSTYRKKAHRFYEAHGYVKDHYNYTKDL